MADRLQALRAQMSREKDKRDSEPGKVVRSTTAAAAAAAAPAAPPLAALIGRPRKSATQKAR